MFLEELSNIPGVSGDEREVRRFIRAALPKRGVTLQTDAMGNLLVHKGTGRPMSRVPRIMLSAHMDEVGLMISSIEKTGHLRFRKIGGIDDRVLVSRTVVVGRDKIPGVIGAKAIHLQKAEERKKSLEIEQLFIDIGVRNKEEAEKIVKIGDYASFDTSCIRLGQDCFMGKAFDDRVGCSILLELLRQKKTPPFSAAFTVQEEVGLRGATVAAYTLKPDLALVLEGTAASDVPGIKEHQHLTSLGGGPAISFMDRSMIVDRELLEKMIRLAQKNKMPFQLRRFTGGGTDGGSISLSRGGVKTAVLSVPCRYIHAPSSILKESDYRHTVDLARAFLDSAAGWNKN
ncbi:MAG: M42 family metallopeptidase [Dethiobacteria bacterium]